MINTIFHRLLVHHIIQDESLVVFKVTLDKNETFLGKGVIWKTIATNAIFL